MALAGGLFISLDSLLASPDSSAKDASLGEPQQQCIILREARQPRFYCSAAV